MPMRRTVSRTNSSASATTAPEPDARQRRPARPREVEHLVDDLGDARDLVARSGRRSWSTSAASPAFLVSARARPPMTLSGVPSSCAISAAIWPMVASFSAWRSRSSSVQPRAGGALALLARLAQRAGHGVEPAGDGADLVVALREDDARQVALGDGVDALDQPAQRLAPPSGAARTARPARRRRRRTGTAARSGAPSPTPPRRCSRCRGACRCWRPACAPGGARQLQADRVVERHRHRVRARARLRVEQPADGRILDVGRLHQQQPRLDRPCFCSRRRRQHLQLEQLAVLARRADALVEELAERVAAAAATGSRPARSAAAISCASRPRSASRFARRTLSAA